MEKKVWFVISKLLAYLFNWTNSERNSTQMPLTLSFPAWNNSRTGDNSILFAIKLLQPFSACIQHKSMETTDLLPSILSKYFTKAGIPFSETTLKALRDLLYSSPLIKICSRISLSTSLGSIANWKSFDPLFVFWITCIRDGVSSCAESWAKTGLSW